MVAIVIKFAGKAHVDSNARRGPRSTATRTHAFEATDDLLTGCRELGLGQIDFQTMVYLVGNNSISERFVKTLCERCSGSSTTMLVHQSEWLCPDCVIPPSIRLGRVPL